MAGAGYFMGNAGNAVANQGPGVLGNIISSLFDGGASTKRPRQSKSQRRTRKNKPNAWDSFERHQEWQYQEGNDRRAANPQAQQVMDMVAGVAGQVFQTGNWWAAVKSLGKGNAQSDGNVEGAKSEAKERAGSGKSRSR